MTDVLYQSLKTMRERPLSTSRRSLATSSGKYSSSLSTKSNVPEGQSAELWEISPPNDRMSLFHKHNVLLAATLQVLAFDILFCAPWTTLEDGGEEGASALQYTDTSWL